VAAYVIGKKPEIPSKRNMRVRKCFHSGLRQYGTRQMSAQMAESEEI
jgi:hypothetical protein